MGVIIYYLFIVFRSHLYFRKKDNVYFLYDKGAIHFSQIIMEQLHLIICPK